MKNLDLLAIGDITTDAFIRLKEASVNCDVNRERCTISMSFGDKIPYEFVEVIRSVGNSPNAAVSAARLGLNSGLVAHVGDDQNGKECIENLKKESVDTTFVEVQTGKQTNYHYVLWYEDDRTILVKHQPFDYSLPDIDNPKWIYLSSLGESTEKYHEQIAEYLKTHNNTKLAFQPGTFQMELGTEKLKDIYSCTEIFFCNVEEAGRILGIDTLGIPELLKRLHNLGPKNVIITDGPKGAYAFDGINSWFMLPYPDPKPPYERTGAGDAFASTVVSAIILGENLQTAFMWGTVNSMAVVQEIGAQKGLLSKEKLKEYLKSAPDTFKIKKV